MESRARRPADDRDLVQAVHHGVFRRDLLEGVWRVDQRSGLDDLLPDAPGSWDAVYFEKGRVGFVRVGKRRVRFEMSVDEPAHTSFISRGVETAAPSRWT